MGNSKPDLIPRELLLGNAERMLPTISPDGQLLAWIAPDDRGVRQVWVRTFGKDDDRIVTAEASRGIRDYQWAWDSTTILYSQDNEGDENFHLIAVDLQNGNVRDLTPWQGVRSQLIRSSPTIPDQIVVALNIRNRELMEPWRINIKTDAAELDTENPGDVAGWMADADLQVRQAQVIKLDGSTEIRVRESITAPWRVLIAAPADDELYPLSFDGDGTSLYLATSIGSDTMRIVAKDIANGTETEIAKNRDAEATHVVLHPTRLTIQAVGHTAARQSWTVVDDDIKADFEAIAKIEDADFVVASRDLADRIWIVALTSGHNPVHYYVWDRQDHKAEFLFSARPKLDSLPLSSTHPITYPARDGMQIHAYLTLPGAEPKNLPLVLNVHGGPWARDFWAFDLNTQLFANRGYAVIQINYRGSSGYGKKYLHAGDGQFGLKMQDDLTDGAKWAVDEGIADPNRIAIHGGSYGGYAVLAAAAFTPEAYRCGVDVVGPSSLFTLIRSFPKYWQMRGIWHARVGNPDDPADEEVLRAASPLFAAERIKIPLLIGQGANDPRVTKIESEQIVAAIEKNMGGATYVLYPDEGHGFARAENRLDFTARMEKFLADTLGGRYEPMDGDRIAGSSAVVRVVGSSKAVE